MNREPLLLPGLAFCGGLLAGRFFFMEMRGFGIAVATVAALMLITFMATRKKNLRLLSVVLLVTVVGLGVQSYRRPMPAPQLDAEDSETVVLSGCVVDPPVFSPDRERFLLQLAPKADALVVVTLKDGERLSLDYGQRVEVIAKVRQPRRFENPGEFDYPLYLAQQQVFWTASVRGTSEIHPVPGRCGSRMVALLYGIRTTALGRLEKLYAGDSRTAALLQAILLGQTVGVERRWTNDFRLTGTYHALVISGQHVTVLALSLLFLLRLLHLGRIPSLGVAAVACWFYAFLSGMGSPVVRAAGGFTLLLIASYCFRRIRILNSLAIVAFIYLFFSPDLLLDASFQLSFLSAAAIAVFAMPLMQRCTVPMRAAVRRFRQPRYDLNIDDPAASQWRVELRLLAETIRLWTSWPRGVVLWLVEWGTRLTVFILDAMLISACIQFALALPMIMYFHRLSLTGLTANVIVVPLLSGVIPAGFAAILTGWHWLAWLTKLLLNWAEAVATWHANIEPGWRIADIPVALSIAFAASLVLLAWTIRTAQTASQSGKRKKDPVAPDDVSVVAQSPARRNRWTRLAWICSLALFTAIYAQLWPPLVRAGWLEVSGLDVSQGDSLLVVFPRGATMLVDAGGFPGLERMTHKPQIDIGEDVVSPYLWWRRIHRLDYVVLTHGHSDHMAGLPAVMDNFRPKELWTGAEPNTAAWQAVEQHAARDGVRTLQLRRQVKPFWIDGAEVRVLAPSTEYQPGPDAHNNDSLVLEIRFGQRSVFLAGDAELAVEGEMLADGLVRPVTLLKVGHHGSKTSSSEEFLSALNPQFALISAGYKNQFHHPHPSVIARLANHRVTVLRTDEHGLITFRTDGEHVEFSGFR
ncbi:MAG: ComEC/Rec2 family competence protein [Bryobacteraceae bacterium]